jgi:hypothetical protein
MRKRSDRWPRSDRRAGVAGEDLRSQHAACPPHQDRSRTRGSLPGGLTSTDKPARLGTRQACSGIPAVPGTASAAFPRIPAAAALRSSPLGMELVYRQAVGFVAGLGEHDKGWPLAMPPPTHTRSREQHHQPNSCRKSWCHRLPYARADPTGTRGRNGTLRTEDTFSTSPLFRSSTVRAWGIALAYSQAYGNRRATGGRMDTRHPKTSDTDYLEDQEHQRRKNMIPSGWTKIRGQEKCGHHRCAHQRSGCRPRRQAA